MLLALIGCHFFISLVYGANFHISPDRFSRYARYDQEFETAKMLVKQQRSVIHYLGMRGFEFMAMNLVFDLAMRFVVIFSLTGARKGGATAEDKSCKVPPPLE